MDFEDKEPKVEGIQEVVIAVEDMGLAVALYEDLFGLKFNLEWSMPNENMNVKAAQLGETQLHMVESTSPEGVIAKSIRSKGEGLHHIAFRVSNLQKMIARLRGRGAKLVPSEPVITPRGSYIFVHPKSARGVLVELIESKN